MLLVAIAEEETEEPEARTDAADEQLEPEERDGWSRALDQPSLTRMVPRNSRLSRITIAPATDAHRGEHRPAQGRADQQCDRAEPRDRDARDITGQHGAVVLPQFVAVTQLQPRERDPARRKSVRSRLASEYRFTCSTSRSGWTRTRMRSRASFWPNAVSSRLGVE